MDFSSHLTMFLVLVLIALISSPVEGIDNSTEWEGIENLLGGTFTKGIYATCNIIFFKEQVDFDTADNNCQRFDIDYTTSDCWNIDTYIRGGDIGIDTAGFDYRDISVYNTVGSCLRACISIPSLCEAFTWIGPDADNSHKGCHLKDATWFEAVNETDMYSMEMSCYNDLPGTASMFSTGNLVTINDDDKNHDIKYLLGLAYEETSETWASDQWVWSGLRKVRNNYGESYTDVYNVNDWEWADGDIPTAFEHWMEDKPDQYKEMNNGIQYYQNQVRINHDGNWDDTFEFKVHPYACDYKGKYIISPKKKTWLDARDACEEAGLTLAMVKSAYDVDELEMLISHILGPRTSKLKYDSSNWIWVGGNDLDSEGTWVWPDGDPVREFAGFAWQKPGQPDNAQYIGTNGQDVLAFSKWGTFDDSFTTKRKRAFACQCSSL